MYLYKYLMNKVLTYICAQLLVKGQAPSIEHKCSVKDLSLIYLLVQHNKIPVLVHMLWMLESFALVSIVPYSIKL